MWKDFKTFIMRGNVVDLAVAVVIGAAFGAIIKSLVDDIIMPPISILTGKLDFSSRFFMLKDVPAPHEPFATPAAAKAAGAVTLNYGLFLNNLLAFLIVAFVIFLVVRAINRVYSKPAPVTDTSRPCPFCTMPVAKAATRCPNCTSELMAVA